MVRFIYVTSVIYVKRDPFLLDESVFQCQSFLNDARFTHSLLFPLSLFANNTHSTHTHTSKQKNQILFTICYNYRHLTTNSLRNAPPNKQAYFGRSTKVVCRLNLKKWLCTIYGSFISPLSTHTHQCVAKCV